jgi:trk system potassium uptake protein TrkA
MMIGGGEIAFYLTKLLLSAGIKVKIIEKNLSRCDILWDTFPKATIVHGDGTDRHLLEEEGIDQTEGFVSLTPIDEENVILSLYAHKMGAVKTVTKINRYVFEDVLESLELDSLIYPRDITAEYILQYVRAMKNSIGSNVETLHQIIDKKVEALEFIVRDSFRMIGRPIKELPLQQDILLACITRSGKVILPRGDDRLEAGDSVIVVTTQKGLNDINGILA